MRPELQFPPEIFYNESEARKYTSCSRIIHVQSKITERALELLSLPDDGVTRLLLDIGCGSGLSGETISKNGHQWIGLDISQAMLDVAIEREVEGDLLLGDMGQGLGLRPGVFDGAICISAVQWLCNADKSSHNPMLRLRAFFGSLDRCLARGARVVFQLYPDSIDQYTLILKSAMTVGFSGGMLTDYPHSTKSKKVYLVLTHGQPSPLSKAIGENVESCLDDDEEHQVCVYNRNVPSKKQKLNVAEGRRKWVIRKKERNRKKGQAVPQDTKYTGRKRKACI